MAAEEMNAAAGPAFRVPIKERKLLRIREFAEYVGLGRIHATQLAEQMGAVIRMNRTVLIDRERVDAELEKMRVAQNGGAS